MKLEEEVRIERDLYTRHRGSTSDQNHISPHRTPFSRSPESSFNFNDLLEEMKSIRTT
jgi:hypothetical protein